MRVLIVGNAGSGKSTLARRLAHQHGLALLDLDTCVWEYGQVAVKRPEGRVLADLDAFIAGHARWVIEGCYGELIQHAAPHATQLVFLDPGIEVCLAHNRDRAWEPHKYVSAQVQAGMLEALQTWVAEYHTRDGDCSYRGHRALFDAHAGSKCVLHSDAEVDAFVDGLRR